MSEAPPLEACRNAVRSHIVTMGEWVLDRDIEALTRHCTLPFITYLQDAILVLDNWCDLKALWRSHCEALAADGPFDAQMRFRAHRAKGDGRHSVVVDWHLTYRGSAKQRHLSTCYMFRVSDDCREIALEVLEDVTGTETDLARIAKRHYAQLARR